MGMEKEKVSARSFFVALVAFSVWTIDSFDSNFRRYLHRYSTYFNQTWAKYINICVAIWIMWQSVKVSKFCVANGKCHPSPAIQWQCIVDYVAGCLNRFAIRCQIFSAAYEISLKICFHIFTPQIPSPQNIRIHRWILGWIEILHAQQHRRDISWLREALHWIGTEATSKNGNFFENLNLTSDKRERVGKNNDNASKLFHIFFFPCWNTSFLFSFFFILSSLFV